MKSNNLKQYAKALADVLSKNEVDEKKVADNFVKLLAKTGQQAKAKKILELASDELLKKQGGRKITFETARKLSAEHKKILTRFLSDKDIVNEKVVPDLIAGIKIIINESRQFDASLRAKLQNIL